MLEDDVLESAAKEVLTYPLELGVYSLLSAVEDGSVVALPVVTVIADLVPLFEVVVEKLVSFALEYCIRDGSNDSVVSEG